MVAHRPGTLWVFVGLTAALGAPGCAGGGRHAVETRAREIFTVEYREDAVPVHRVVAYPVDRVWAALPEAFRALGYPGAPSAVPGERVFLTPYLAVKDRLYPEEPNSAYFVCARTNTVTAAVDAWRITFAILVRLTPESDGQTAVDVILDGNATDRTERTMSVHCTGTGRLEGALLDLIERQARASGG